ncbi:MAG: cell division protein ZapA [Gammaproteobacteria bacterium]|nr:cell division protein ZapA [Gammaproteobacteria bacterium]MDH3560602.1 cell division protein ZapA [Gammaproteobacteria bacterium]
MSKGPNAVKVHILDKEYLVSCPEEEKDALLSSAKFLNDKMADIRASGKVVGIDRIAVMTALNLAHNVLEAESVDTTQLDAYGTRIRELNNRIETALDKYKLELN